MSDSTFLTRVELYNYKSIAHCDVKLGPLMFLVGPNGAGKSNFLDALRFVSDALNTSLDQAIRQRGGIRELYRREADDTQNLVICLEFRLPSEGKGYYKLCIGKNADGGYVRQTEECRFRSAQTAGQEKFYSVDGDTIYTSEMIKPTASADRLYLVAASNIFVFRPIYDLLSRMAFYNINPALLRRPQEPDALERLAYDGGNTASILKRLGERLPEAKRRLEEFMAALIPGVKSISVMNIGSYQMLEFDQRFMEGSLPNLFPASSMSDGTLRALAVLVALYQGWSEEASPVPLVGIEEPETGLHPAAAEALLGAMEEASLSKQILVTTHSDDILDNKEITAAMLLAVVAEDGVTRIGPLDRAGQYALREHLYTAGELQRINQLHPGPDAEAERETEAPPVPAGGA